MHRDNQDNKTHGNRIPLLPKQYLFEHRGPDDSTNLVRCATKFAGVPKIFRYL